MKTLLITSLIVLPSFGYCQIQEPTPAVNLKMEQVDKEQQKQRNKAKAQMVIGAAISTLGVGVGLIGPTLINEPTDPSAKYLREVQLAGDNKTAIASLTKKYQTDINYYNGKLEDKQSIENGLRAGGVGLFAVGQMFNISGIVKLVREL